MRSQIAEEQRVPQSPQDSSYLVVAEMVLDFLENSQLPRCEESSVGNSGFYPRTSLKFSAPNPHSRSHRFRSKFSVRARQPLTARAPPTSSSPPLKLPVELRTTPIM